MIIPAASSEGEITGKPPFILCEEVECCLALVVKNGRYACELGCLANGDNAAVVQDVVPLVAQAVETIVKGASTQQQPMNCGSGVLRAYFSA